MAEADCYLPNPRRKRLRLLPMQEILHRVKTDLRPGHPSTRRVRVYKRHLQVFPTEISMGPLVTRLGPCRNATLVLNIAGWGNSLCDRKPTDVCIKYTTTQEGYKQHTERQLLERGISTPSTPGGKVQLSLSNTLSSDVHPSQVPQQNWEGILLILASQRTEPNIRQQ